MLQISPVPRPVLLRGASGMDSVKESVKKGVTFLAVFSAIGAVVWLASRR